MREHHYLVTYRVRALSEHLLYTIKVEECRVTPALQADSNPLWRKVTEPVSNPPNQGHGEVPGKILCRTSSSALLHHLQSTNLINFEKLHTSLLFL